MANPAFTDETINLVGKNGQAPCGSVERAIAQMIRIRQHEGRHLYHWWNGLGTSTTGTLMRIVRPNFLEGGGRRLRSDAHVTANGGANATAGLILSGHANPRQPPLSGSIDYNIGNTNDDDDNVTGLVDEITIGATHANLLSGCLYEDGIPSGDVIAAETVDASKWASGREIIATQTSSLGDDESLVERFQHVWRNRGVVYNWTAGENSYVDFIESPGDWRYIFDQTVGDTGTAPSATGPAITLPAYAAGIQRQATVRVYVYVLAAMSGNTDTGVIGVANKDSNGTMQTSFSALTNGAAISGTTFSWYPGTGAFDPAAGPYFEAPTGVAFDRVCFGAKSGGVTDTVKVRSFAFFVYPSLV